MGRFRVGLATVVLAVAAGAAPTYYEVTKDMTPEQVKSFREKMREDRYRRTGGRILNLRTMEGKIVFVNAQKRIAEDALNDIPQTLRQRFSRDVVWSNSPRPIPWGELPKIFLDGQKELQVVITDDVSMPALLVAPEAGWAAVNVASLESNDREKFVRRVRRETLRAFAYLCSAGGSSVEGSVMNAVKGTDDIDAITGEGFPMETFIAIEAHLLAIGIKPFTSTTYRAACQEGWAPAPTNAIQRKIWDEAHTPPSKPLKITYDKDKQKPVVK